MTILKKLITTAVLALGVSSAAHATYMSGVYITTDSPFSATFTIAQQQNMAIESAKLSLLLSDPLDGWWNTKEVLTVKFDNKVAGTIKDVDYTAGIYSFSVLPSLLSDGKLNVSLSLGCNVGKHGSCASQDVWLHDMLLAINRVPTTPTVPAVPPVKPPVATPTVPTVPTQPPVVEPAVPVAPPAAEPAVPSAPADSNPTPPLVTLPVPPTSFEPVSPSIPVDLPADTGSTPAAPAQVPEPATLLTLGLGLLGLAAARRRS